MDKSQSVHTWLPRSGLRSGPLGVQLVNHFLENKTTGYIHCCSMGYPVSVMCWQREVHMYIWYVYTCMYTNVHTLADVNPNNPKRMWFLRVKQS
jgi:hypothetical protein